MAGPITTPNPEQTMVIRDVKPGVVILSTPFLRHGLLRLGGRATIVKLSSGNLAVFSPVALTDAVRARIAQLGGEVRYLVAPDIEHHIFLSAWSRAYPSALLVGPEGLPEKRQAAAPSSNGTIDADEKWHAIFRESEHGKTTVSPEFDADFDYEYVPSHPNREIAFVHRASRTLIQADLLFNLPAAEQYSRVPEADKKQHAFLNGIFDSLNMARGTEAQINRGRRFHWHVVSRRDRPSYSASVARIAGWDFDTMIPCHGDVIEGDARDVFSTFFKWHIEAFEKEKKTEA